MCVGRTAGFSLWKCRSPGKYCLGGRVRTIQIAQESQWIGAAVGAGDEVHHLLGPANEETSIEEDRTRQEQA